MIVFNFETQFWIIFWLIQDMKLISLDSSAWKLQNSTNARAKRDEKIMWKVNSTSNKKNLILYNFSVAYDKHFLHDF